VITATNRLMSQKLSTTMQVIKKKQQRKYSESITVYINCVHYNKQVKERQYDYGLDDNRDGPLTPLADDTINTCRAEK
jgi:hypothetical protein